MTRHGRRGRPHLSRGLTVQSIRRGISLRDPKAVVCFYTTLENLDRKSVSDTSTENTKNVLCRNITIYGSCRAQNNGCPPNKQKGTQSMSGQFCMDLRLFSAKRFLNVDSPSFKPLSPVTNSVQPAKNLGISPKAASAAVFTPKATTAVPIASAKQPSTEWSQRGIQEFVPQNFVPQVVPCANRVVQRPRVVLLPTIFPHSTRSPCKGILVRWPMLRTRRRSTHMLRMLLPWLRLRCFQLLRLLLIQYADNPSLRTTHDFFIPDHLREEMQRKSEASLQTFSIRISIRLSKLDIQGHFEQRRLQLCSEAPRSNGNVVTVHDAFTTRAFGDSSLIVVTDYHPLSQTLADKIFTPNTRNPGGTLSRSPGSYVTDHELWGYIVQLASALKAIHSIGLAARLMTPQKILITSKSRLRLNSCGILDITQYEQGRSISELQQDDILQMGRLILCIANKNPTAHHNTQKSLEHVGRAYSEKMREVVTWLLTPAAPMTPTQAPTSSPAPAAATTSSDHDIDSFLSLISSQITLTFDASLHEADSLTSNLSRELENARLVRLLTKLNMILERPEATLTSNAANPNQPAAPHSLNHTSSAWSETGERYYLKLFRDYVFHQVDADGRPVLDLGHILTCLNKLDAGIEEKIMLVSRDEQNCFVVSYREVKRGFESAWTELMKATIVSIASVWALSMCSRSQT
ncbi:PAB-dependent poly(A)-specific ribonuclease subunit pan3, partial [Aureobasidium melanogenum]